VRKSRSQEIRTFDGKLIDSAYKTQLALVQFPSYTYSVEFSNDRTPPSDHKRPPNGILSP